MRFRPHPAAADGELQSAALAMLQTAGLDAADFRVSADVVPDPLSHLESSATFLTIAQRSTGQRACYFAGMHSTWLAQLVIDLDAGRFAPPSRHAC